MPKLTCLPVTNTILCVKKPVLTNSAKSIAVLNLKHQEIHRYLELF